MPVDIDDLARRERTIELDYDGEAVEVRYRPHLFDSTVYNSIVLGTAPESDDEAFGVMIKLLAGWNLTRKGKPLPITKETLTALPWALLRDISNAIGKDLFGGTGADAGPNGVAPS